MRPGRIAKLRALASAKPMHSNTPPIGVDFGVFSIKVLQVDVGDQPSLIAAAELETPENLRSDHSERLSFQLDALPGLIASGGFNGTRVVPSIPATNTLCKPLRVEQTAGISTNALVQGALAVQLGCDLNEIVYRFVKVCEAPNDKSGARTELICFATARRLVDRIIRGCREAKLEPVGIQNQFSANASVIAASDVAMGSTLCVDIGAGSTKVVITHDDKIVFAKNIDVGGMHLDETIARQLGVEYAEAHEHRLAMDELTTADSVSYRADASASEALDEGSGFAILSAALKRDGVDPSESRTPVAEASPRGKVDLSEPMEILTDEIGMCLRYHQSVFPDERIAQALFVGGESSHEGFVRQVAGSLRTQATTMNPLACVSRSGAEPTGGVDLGEPQPGWSVALGLCLCPTDL